METLAVDLNTMARTPLAEAHVRALRRNGAERSYAAGEIVAELGAPILEFIYVLEGEIEAMDPVTGDRFGEQTLGPTQFFGEISFLTGGTSMLGARAVTKTQVLAVPRDAVLRLMSELPEMSDIIVTVLAGRRRRLLESNRAALTILGAQDDPALRQIAAFAGRNRIPVRALELNTSEALAEAKMCRIDPGKPALIFGSERVIDDPTPAKVARLLGLDIAIDTDEMHDVLIVGGGPAGISAGVYAGAEGLTALVLDDLAIGGQAGTSSRIENYMGFPTGISGADLCWRGEVQAMKFGTRFAVPRRAVGVERRADSTFCVTLDNGREICTRAIVVATGVQYRKLPINGLERFESNGVYYAATDVEARYCRDTEVVVIGGGNSAGQAAMFMSRTARHVHVLVRGSSLAKSMSDYLSSRLTSNPSITLHYNTHVTGLEGKEGLEQVTICDNASGHDWTIRTAAVFVMVGAAPNTAWLSGLVALDDRGFVRTGAEVGGATPFATSQPGIFAVGDVRAGSVKRVTSAVGEGSVAISSVWEHVNGP